MVITQLWVRKYPEESQVQSQWHVRGKDWIQGSDEQKKAQTFYLRHRGRFIRLESNVKQERKEVKDQHKQCSLLEVGPKMLTRWQAVVEAVLK